MRHRYKLASYLVLLWIFAYFCHEYWVLQSLIKRVRVSIVEKNEKRDLSAFRALHEKIMKKELPLRVIFNKVPSNEQGYANMVIIMFFVGY